MATAASVAVAPSAGWALKACAASVLEAPAASVAVGVVLVRSTPGKRAASSAGGVVVAALAGLAGAEPAAPRAAGACAAVPRGDAGGGEFVVHVRRPASSNRTRGLRALGLVPSTEARAPNAGSNVVAASLERATPLPSFLTPPTWP